MSYTNINKSTDYFNTKLYTGNGSAGHAITGVGFQPDWVWIKNRDSATEHSIFDAVRGATYRLASNNTDAQSAQAAELTAFGSDGFTTGNAGGTNGSGNGIVAWNWKANGSGSANSDGSINSTVSANTTSGFSIVKFVGSGGTATVGHGLGVAPKMIIIKYYGGSASWGVYHQSLGNTKAMFLDLDATDGTSNDYWNSTSPTSSVFTVNTFSGFNYNGGNMVAYCFAEKNGFSKFGTYTGNGEPNNDNPFIYTGFKPSFVMLKVTNTTDSWNMYDNRRDGYNGTGGRLRANVNNAEDTGTNYQTCDFYANGFSPKGNDTTSNGNGRPYIYMAFGQPIVSTNGDIATAR